MLLSEQAGQGQIIINPKQGGEKCKSLKQSNRTKTITASIREKNTLRNYEFLFTRFSEEENGIKPSSELVFFVKPRETEGYNVTRELLKLSEPPDAIFTGNGLLSAGAFRALRESSLKIPEEIAFATFDETLWSTLVDPPFTVIQQPTYEIGNTAVELLVKRINDPTRSTRVVTLKSKLIVRQSCGCQK